MSGDSLVHNCFFLNKLNIHFFKGKQSECFEEVLTPDWQRNYILI